MDRGLLGVLGLVAVLALGCTTAPPADAPLARGPTGGRALVVVLDTSLASEGVRPAAQASLEAALALTSGGPGARLAVGVIGAADGESAVVVSLDDQDDAAREALARKVSAIPREGRSSPAKGVRRALDMLTASQAERGSIVLLLAAERDERELGPLASELAQRGMKLHAVALGGGARDAVVDVAGQALGYALARAVPSQISGGGAFGGGRLAWIATGGTLPEGGAGSRSLKGVATDARVWDRMPEKLALTASGDEAHSVLLYRPTWELAFETDAPPPIVYVGEPVPIGLLVRGGALPPASSLQVSLWYDRHDVAGPEALKGVPVSGGLRYDGVSDPCSGEGPGRAEVTVDFELGAAHFHQPVEARYVARVRTGPQPPRVHLAPERLDLGVAWVGTRLTSRLVVQGDPQRPTHVELETVAGASALAPLDLLPGEEKTLELSFEPGRLAAGTRLKVTAQVAGLEGSNVRPRARGEYARRDPLRPLAGVPSWTGVVPVAFEARSARIADSFALGPLEPGGEVALEGPLEVSPRSAVEVVARFVDAKGVSVVAKLEGGKLTLVARAEAGAAVGRREGVVEVRLAGSHAAPLTRPLSVEVAPRPALALDLQPTELAIHGRYGWAEARVQVGANEHARLALVAGPLEGESARITPRRDIRLVASDRQWDTKTLEPGQSRELVVRVYLGSDLPAGLYTGALSLRLEGAPGRQAVVRVVPVALEVQR